MEQGPGEEEAEEAEEEEEFLARLEVLRQASPRRQPNLRRPPATLRTPPNRTPTPPASCPPWPTSGNSTTSTPKAGGRSILACYYHSIYTVSNILVRYIHQDTIAFGSTFKP